MGVGIAQKVAILDDTLFAVPHYGHHHKCEVLNAPTNDANASCLSWWNVEYIYLVVQLNVVNDCATAVFVRTIFGTYILRAE